MTPPFLPSLIILVVYGARTKLETFHSSTHCHSKTWKPPRHTLVDHGHHGNSVLQQVSTLGCSVCLEATLTNTRRCPEHIWSSQMQVQELVLWLPSYLLWATVAHTATLCRARNTTRRLGTIFKILVERYCWLLMQWNSNFFRHCLIGNLILTASHTFSTTLYMLQTLSVCEVTELLAEQYSLAKPKYLMKAKAPSSVSCKASAEVG